MTCGQRDSNLQEYRGQAFAETAELSAGTVPCEVRSYDGLGLPIRGWRRYGGGVAGPGLWLALAATMLHGFDSLEATWWF